METEIERVRQVYRKERAEDMTEQAEQRWGEWRSQTLEDADLTRELEEIQGNEEAIEDRFYRELEFGTGGLRGVIGAGTNRMNIYTVAKASQGYADYLNAQGAQPTVAIAYDSRIKSELFARTAAGVFAANGIRVHIYRELMPTPALSFAVRHLGCSGGVVVTASHNPAKYNGYKVYGSDGCQITTKAAKEILGCIGRVDIFNGVKKMDFAHAVREKLVCYIDTETVDAYIRAVSAQSLSESTEENRRIRKEMAIVYTPLNGTGRYCVTRTLRENGFENIVVVKEQEQPDGNFPTCPYPNPEIREAMELGISWAEKTGSDLLLATDPDCDRVGIAVKTKKGFTLLTGNEVGLLLLDYICRRRIALGTMPERPVAVKTIVTIDMAKKIAEHYGVEMREVLTGFKFIGEQIGLLEQQGEAERFILGFEESYGYLSGSYVRDKDGVDASLLICEMAAYYREQGMTLWDAINQIYKKYGYCLNTLHSYTFEGVSGFEKMQAIMASFREDMPAEFGGRAVEAVSDYKNSVTRKKNGEEEAIDLPVSNVLKFWLEGNSSAVIRPSGTEPKLKLYLSVSAPDRGQAETLETRILKDVEEIWRKIDL